MLSIFLFAWTYDFESKINPLKASFMLYLFGIISKQGRFLNFLSPNERLF